MRALTNFVFAFAAVVANIGLAQSNAANVPVNSVNSTANAQLSALKALERRGAKVSAMFVDLSTKQVLASLNASERLAPASLTKALLGAVALETWGSEKAFVTSFVSNGAQVGSTLKGDLMLVGSGDPYLTNEKLWFLATDVARAGIRDVSGDLVLNTSKFAPVIRDENRQAGKNFSTHAYDSPLSAVAVNFSVLAAVAFPGNGAGKPAQIALEPYPLDSVKLRGSVQTKGSGAGRIQAARSNLGNSDALTVSGNIAMGEAGLRAYRSVSDAERYSGDVLRAFLKAAGVNVRGRVRIDTSVPSPRARLVASVEGFPIDWQLRGLFKVSNNFIGDMMTILLDAENKSSGASMDKGAKVIEQYVTDSLKKTTIKTIQSRTPLNIESGSGLTPENRISAQDFVVAFDRVYSEGRNFPSFLAALPIPGAEGTVKKRFSKESERHLQNFVRAKTGTLSEPVDAVSLGGYVQRPNGRWIAFAAIVNGTQKVPSLGLDNIRSALDDCVAELVP